MNLPKPQKERLSLNTCLILLCVFLAALNIFNRYYYFTFIAFFLFVVKPNRKFYLSPSSLALLLLGAFWAIFSPYTSASVFGIVKPFSYLLCFVMGLGLSDDAKLAEGETVSFNIFYKLAIVLGGGTLFHYFLNWITNLDVSSSIDRNTIDIWTNEPLAATGQATLACIPLALAIAALFAPIAKKWKVVASGTLLIILVYNLVLAGRTLILLTIITLGVALLFTLIVKPTGKIKTLVICLALVILLGSLYIGNFFGIRSLVESSPFYDRFFTENSMDIDTDYRLDRKLFYFQNMHKYPFGGAHIRAQRGYSHDLFFDSYDEAGIFAFLPLIFYMIASLIHFIRAITAKHLPFSFRLTVFCLYLVLYMQFWLEPILQGCAWLFASFCFLDGYVTRVLAATKPTRHV